MNRPAECQSNQSLIQMKAETRGLQTVAFSSGGFVMGVKSMNGVFYHSELNGWKSL